MYLIITKCWLQTNKQTQWTRSQIFIQRNYYKKKIRIKTRDFNSSKTDSISTLSYLWQHLFIR